LSSFAREASAALFLLVGCAGGAGARQDLDALRAEVRALRRDNDALARQVDSLSGRVDLVIARLTRSPAEARPDTRPAGDAAHDAPVVPPDLAVVKVGPADARGDAPAPKPASRGARPAPPVPTSVAIAEPDPERLDALARPSRRELSAEADGELRAARKRAGLARAHGLEDFVARYPRHASADNALLEAAEAYADGGQDEAACALARRAADDYPAGDAMSGALERLAACEAGRGAASAERRLLERLLNEYPGTPAATRAGARLASISGRAGDSSPAAAPARSSP
jgi:TolA-binding protein